MRIAALLVLLSVGVTGAWANRAVIDSLKQELHSAMAGNASRDCLSGIYQQLSAWYEETDADSSLYYLEKDFNFLRPRTIQNPYICICSIRKPPIVFTTENCGRLAIYIIRSFSMPWH